MDLGQLQPEPQFPFRGQVQLCPLGLRGGVSGLPRSKPSPCGHQHGAVTARITHGPPATSRQPPFRRPFHRTYGATRWQRTGSQPRHDTHPLLCPYGLRGTAAASPSKQTRGLGPRRPAGCCARGPVVPDCGPGCGRRGRRGRGGADSAARHHRLGVFSRRPPLLGGFASASREDGNLSGGRMGW